MVYYSVEMCIDTLRYILLLYNANVLLSGRFLFVGMPLKHGLFRFFSSTCTSRTEPPQTAKATPHKARLTALHAICVQIFRHIAQKSLAIRQYACGISRAHKERLATLHAICLQISRHISQNAREYIKYSLRFLFHLTKNLTTHLSHNLCAVLP